MISAENTPAAPPLVFIVDDVPRNIEVLANMLSEKSYRVAFSTSGAQALDMVTDLKPDLILLDIMMPEMDGLEVCRCLKSRPETGEIPIIFLTAKTDPTDILKGFEAGALDYITKPFNSTELLARVRTHIELKQARDAQARLIIELREALDQVRELSGLLPICCYCKKIRDDQGYWQQVELYLSTHADVSFSHGICPECVQKHFPDLAGKKNA